MSQCPKHPDTLATDLCVECGEFVCGQCAWVTADRRVLCPNCQSKEGVSAAPRPKAQPRANLPPPPPRQPFKPTVIAGEKPATKNSKAAIAAIVLPFLCFCYGAPIGLILGIRELTLINKGKSTSSRALVKVSIVLNAIGTALLALVLLAPKK